MTFEFHVSGADRKALVTAMGEILEVKPKYLGMPTAAYEVDYFTIDKEGMVSFDDRADSEEIENLLDRLAERGFTAEKTEKGEVSEETETGGQSENVGLTVAVPLDKVSVGNLTKLLDAKGSLIKKALGIDATPIEIGEDAVSFPWFSEMPDSDTVQAYTHFISALCQMSREQKRITATEKNVENEKYAFRCFLLRLGFIGAEYKTERKILLKNLTGSSAFKNGGADHAVSK
ncbi:MAG: virulence protein [Clostridiales bacterium]|nr:virulence protein [Clostridiales bacterium]